MINKNILNEFKSHTDPNFSIIITDIETNTECNEESITFTVYQINKSVEQLKENAEVTSKKLHIISTLDIDENDLFYSKLKGYISDNATIQESQSGVSSHYIEAIDTILDKEIDIKFTNQYENEPKVIVNINKKYEALYRSLSTTYKKENDKYTGVTLKFNNLKTRSNYPQISVLIIGDEKNAE